MTKFEVRKFENVSDKKSVLQTVGEQQEGTHLKARNKPIGACVQIQRSKEFELHSCNWPLNKNKKARRDIDTIKPNR